MAVINSGVAKNVGDAQATLARYRAVLVKQDGNKIAYSSPYGWLVVTPMAGGAYKFELHGREQDRCPCEA